jgi:transposase
MLYLAIDQHHKQLTVNLRNEGGDAVLKRQLSTDWKRVQKFLEDAENKAAGLIDTIPGAGAYGSLALACRIGSIERFPHARSLAHYWGLTPGCRNSGDATRRLGSITKEGSVMTRFILGQMVLHVLRRDPRMKEWFQRIKKRRGAKIARVAVMRCLASILWQMLKHQQIYRLGGKNAESNYPGCGCVPPDGNALF